MVFSSFPVYVDPPSWNQQPNHHQANGSDSSQLLPPLPSPPQAPHVGTIRPGSMADRARLAKIPPPEAALKCPRCESTNTKFCYFNNYSLTQPRHFCKTCRRYWTRGGALRSVPVGGGCRRNKKSKRSRSKSPASTNDKHTLNSSSTSGIPSGGATAHELIGQLPQPPNLPLMASLQNLNRYGVGNMADHIGFHPIGGSNPTAALGGGGVDQWRLQQFPNFLNGFESPSVGSYPFQSEGTIEVGDIAASSRVTPQLPPVKLEDNVAALNLSRSPALTLSENNQFYSWTDLSGLASSSTSHLL